MSMSIGALAKATAVKIPTIRFYEQIGLLPEPERSASDRRLYGDETVRRLTFIKHARQLGFSVEAIRALLSLADAPEQPCDEANVLAAEQLAAVDAKIARLQLLQAELRRIVEAACHGRVSECRVIEQLSDHDLCVHPHLSPAEDSAFAAT